MCLLEDYPEKPSANTLASTDLNPNFVLIYHESSTVHGRKIKLLVSTGHWVCIKYSAEHWFFRILIRLSGASRYQLTSAFHTQDPALGYMPGGLPLSERA